MGSDRFIVFEAVRKSYDGENYVVRGLDLSVAQGEFLTLLGPSGSGKTTTLMMLAGFEEPTSGTITLDGKRIERVPPHRRNIGVVFQNYALFPHMTVARNIAFPLQMRRLGAAEVAAAGRGAPSTWCAWRGSRSVGPHSCPAVSSSASPWRAHWCSSPSSS